MDHPSTWRGRIGQFIRHYGQILSGLIIGACSLLAAMIISGGLERVFVGDERIGLSVAGFNHSESTKRLVTAHNHGTGTGTLVAEVIIVVNDAGNNELDRPTAILNPGVGAGASPFTLLGNEGRRYFLPFVLLPDKADRCTVEFKVMQRDGNPRKGISPEFPCSK